MLRTAPMPAHLPTPTPPSEPRLRLTPPRPSEPQVSSARAAAPRWRARDWGAVRAGFGEVFFTVAATVAIGLGWAWIEQQRLEPGPPAGASAVAWASGEAGVGPMGPATGVEAGYAAAGVLGR